MENKKHPIKFVSACLAGAACRYDGKSKTNQIIQSWVESGEAIAICPEEMGGLPTPREPAERIGSSVRGITGSDVTSNYREGAQKALECVLKSNATAAYLKSKSPMCGCGRIYDGTFSGQLIAGDGCFTELLKEHHINIIEVD